MAVLNRTLFLAAQIVSAFTGDVSIFLSSFTNVVLTVSHFFRFLLFQDESDSSCVLLAVGLESYISWRVLVTFFVDWYLALSTLMATRPSLLKEQENRSIMGRLADKSIHISK